MRFYVPFNRISVISGQWKGKHERPCAMKRRLASERISPSAGFEPETPWSNFESAKSSAMRLLLVKSWKQENVTLTTMPIIWIGTKTICPFPICGLVDGLGSFGWLVVLRLNGPVNNFQSCRDGAIASWVINQYFRGVKCLAQGHNTAAVGLEPRTSRSGVRHSTTEPPRSPGLGSGYNESVMYCFFDYFVQNWWYTCVNGIKTTKTLSKISSLRWIMHQSFVIPSPPSPTYTHTNGE